MEQCTICKLTYPFTEQYFRKCKNVKSGLNKICRKCNSAIANEYHRTHEKKARPTTEYEYIDCDICRKKINKYYLRKHQQTASHRLILESRQNIPKEIWV